MSVPSDQTRSASFLIPSTSLFTMHIVTRLHVLFTTDVILIVVNKCLIWPTRWPAGLGSELLGFGV